MFKQRDWRYDKKMGTKIPWKHVARTISQANVMIKITVSRLNIAQGKWKHSWRVCEGQLRWFFNVKEAWIWPRGPPEPGLSSSTELLDGSRWDWNYVCDNLEVCDKRGRIWKGYCNHIWVGPAESERKKRPEFTLWWPLRTGDTRVVTKRVTDVQKTLSLIHTDTRNELPSKSTSA